MTDQTTRQAVKDQDPSSRPEADVQGAEVDAGSKKTLVAAAMAMLHRMTAAGPQAEAGAQSSSSAAGAGASAHPMLERVGEAAGLGLGVLVTEALRAVPSWNKPVVDAAGQPVASVPGAERIGDHDLLKRHEEVVGPKIAELVDKLAPGAVHDLLAGLGKGATEAPGASYQLESKASDLLHGKSGS